MIRRNVLSISEVSIDFMPLSHLWWSGNSGFSVQSLVFLWRLCMLALQPATSNLLMKMPRPPPRPASLSVDQYDVFIELIATTLLLIKHNFISKWHMALKPFSVGAFWTTLSASPSAAPSPPVTSGHSNGSQSTTTD